MFVGLQDMKNALLDNADLNVVLVEWSTGASTVARQAAANTRVVGASVAAMVKALEVRRRTCSLRRCE